MKDLLDALMVRSRVGVRNWPKYPPAHARRLRACECGPTGGNTFDCTRSPTGDDARLHPCSSVKRTLLGRQRSNPNAHSWYHYYGMWPDSLSLQLVLDDIITFLTGGESVIGARIAELEQAERWNESMIAHAQRHIDSLRAEINQQRARADAAEARCEAGLPLLFTGAKESSK